VSDNPILAISERAAQLRAAGRDVVSLASAVRDGSSATQFSSPGTKSPILGRRMVDSPYRNHGMRDQIV
jgi:hypothetical protein